MRTCNCVGYMTSPGGRCCMDADSPTVPPQPESSPGVTFETSEKDQLERRIEELEDRLRALEIVAGYESYKYRNL